MKNYKRITVVGMGAWGTALAAVEQRNGHDVTLVGRDQTTCDLLKRNHENREYLPGIKLPSGLNATCDLAKSLEDCDLVLLVAPAQTTRQLAKQIKPHLKASIPLVSCAKGIDKETGQLQTEILADCFPDNTVGVLSGPSFADNVARGLPTAVVLAMQDINQAREISEALSNSDLRLYASDDLIGVQVGGALKNVLAIATGICRGAGLGASAEAALVARGYAEISRLALAMGARQETLMGLSCLGDLILTCSSNLSRNLSYGIAIGQGESQANLKPTEGVHTISIAHQLANAQGIECPIIATTLAVLNRQISLSNACSGLMNRPVKREIE